MSKPIDESVETYAEWLETAQKYQAEKKHAFSVKDGDVLEFLFLRWDEHWEFDFPCVMVSPVYRYSPEGVDPESWIEDIAADLGSMGSIYDDSVDQEEEKQRGWPTPKRFKAIIRERLRGKNTWVKWDAIAHRFLVKFTWNQEEGWLDYTILEHQEA